MAITRRWQSGFELQTLDEVSGVGSSTAISNTKAKTGSYSARISVNDDFYVSIADTAQVRVAFHLNHAGTASPSEVTPLLAFHSGATDVINIGLDFDNGLVVVYDDAVELASGSMGDVAIQNVWNHISVDLKIDAAGWVSVRINGAQVVNFAGDTNNGGANINRVWWGNTGVDPYAGNGSLSNFGYIDDAYIDDTTGEGAATTPPDYRYHLLTPNAQGAANEWDGSDGNSVDNYLLVDDVPKDDDTSYISTDVDGEQDYQGMTTYTLGAGESFVSVIAYMYARKEDGASAAQVKLNIHDGANEVLGTLQDVATSYTLKSERFTTAPDAGAWAQGDVDSLQIGVEINV